MTRRLIPTFERFTERARRVVVLAQEESRELKHGLIGTEHILLGLLREEEAVAARVLESLDVSVERVRREVVRICGYGEIEMAGQIPFTPRAKKVLELALREALSLGHNFIGTEHVLLGLVRENEGIAARILSDLDVNGEKVRNEVIRMLNGPREAPGRPRRHQYLAVIEVDEVSEVDAEIKHLTDEIKDAIGTRPGRRASVTIVHLDPSTSLPSRRRHSQRP